jgi:hypothetical protein
MLGPVYQSPPPEYLRRARGKQGEGAPEAEDNAKNRRKARNNDTDTGQWTMGNGQ